MLSSSPAVPVSASAVPSEIMMAPGNMIGEGLGVPAAVETYLAACEQQRSLKPNGYLMTILRGFDHVVVLDFHGPQFLSDRGCTALSACLRHLPQLRLLSVADNGVGNEGLASLCAAIDLGSFGLNIFDVQKNPRITRTGGQRLLNTVGRSQSLACVNLMGTRVSSYFEVRIQRHAALHYENMGEMQRGTVDALLVSLTCGRTDGRASVARFKSVSVNFMSRSYRNELFDEAYDALSNDGSEEPAGASESLEGAEAISLNAGAHSITKHGNRRTVFSIATPIGLRIGSPGVYASVTPTELAGLAELVEAYKPKNVELEMKFLFPGKIEYVAAAHCPDPMLSPPMPDPITVPDDVPVHEAKPDEGMYWNFFTTAAAAQASGLGGSTDTTGRRRVDDEQTARRRRFELKHASDVICTNSNLVWRPMVDLEAPRSYVLNQVPLSQLLDDPNWNPNVPARASQVDQYLTAHKLKYHTVSGERFSIQSSGTQREYILQRVIRHSITERLTAGALNSRGTLLATSSYDMTCKIWSTESGKKLLTLSGHEGHISECLFNAPWCDKVITASYDKTIKVWHVSDGTLLHTMRGHDSEIIAMVISKDGLKAASGGMDDLAVVWDLNSGSEICTLAGHVGEVITVDFSPAGDKLATGSMDETVRLWNISDGTCLMVLTGHTQEIGHVTFNCFGNVVLSGSIDGTCRLWDVQTGACKVLRGHSREVVDCCFSPTGWQCASVSDDHTVRIWDVITGGCVTMITGHTAGVCHAAFSNTGTELLTGSLDMTARLWRVDTGECLQVLRGHRSVVLVGYSADCDRIMTISKDNSCRIWRREPATNSLLRLTAIAICQHPTVFTEVIEIGVPDHISQVLRRIHKKIFHAEREAVSTPLPLLETPNPDDPDSPTPRFASQSYVVSPSIDDPVVL